MLTYPPQSLATVHHPWHDRPTWRPDKDACLHLNSVLTRDINGKSLEASLEELNTFGDANESATFGDGHG